MPPTLRFLIRRLLAIPVTVLVVTAVMYGVTMLTPPQVRAQLYLTETERTSGNLFELTERVVERYGLDDPFPVQYARWLGRVLRGDLGYSPSLRSGVLEGLLRRTPVTAELTLFAVLFFIPLGLLAGALSGARRNRSTDYGFRVLAFVGTAVPPFILGLVLLAVFYTGLRWFPPDRLSSNVRLLVTSDEFRTFTGMVTIDGLLNGRLDVTLDALRHLVLPVITLSVAHWATLGRITRVVIIDEFNKDYIISARARGLQPARVLWRHAFRNATGPALSSSALAAASLLTGVFIVEIIFNLHGVSEVVTNWMSGNELGGFRIPDTAAVVGFAIYSVVVVQLLMLALDLCHALVNPRFRQGIGEA